MPLPYRREARQGRVPKVPSFAGRRFEREEEQALPAARLRARRENAVTTNENRPGFAWAAFESRQERLAEEEEALSAASL